MVVGHIHYDAQMIKCLPRKVEIYVFSTLRNIQPHIEIIRLS